MSDTRSLPELFAQVRRFIRREHAAADAAGEDCDGANMAETALDEIAERQDALFCGSAMSTCDCSTKGEAYVCRHLRTACKDKR